MPDQDQEKQSRADRLRTRRKDRSRDRDAESSDTDATDTTAETANTDNTDNTDNTVKTDNTPQTDNTSNGGEPDDASNTSQSVGLSQTTREQMMHLTEEQHKELHHVYTRMKADFEYEFDQNFELNRHFFPLVLRHGLDDLLEMDSSTVHDELVEMSDA